MIMITDENTAIIFEIIKGKFLLFASKRAEKRKKAKNAMFLTKSKTASEIFTALKRDNPEIRIYKSNIGKINCLNGDKLTEDLALIITVT